MVRGNARFLSGVHGVLSTCGLSQTRKPSRQWDGWDWSSGERSSLQRSIWQSPALRWWTYLVAQTVKNLPAVQEIQETWVRCLGQEDPLEKGMATHSSILVWRIPRTEETGGLQSMGSCRVRNDWATNTHTALRWYVHGNGWDCPSEERGWSTLVLNTMKRGRIRVDY